jgi:hypothetical protein
MAEAVELSRSGHPICYAIGDDGNMRKGAWWPEAWVNGSQNGMIHDNLTGLE